MEQNAELLKLIKKKDEVIEQLARAVTEGSVLAIDTILDKPCKITFQELSKEWVNDYAEKNHRGTTLYNEGHIVRRTNRTFGERYVDEISAQELQAYVNSLSNVGANLRNGKPLSRKTIKNHFTYLSNVFSYAMQKKYIDENPCDVIQIPKINGNGETMLPKDMQIYTKEQAKILLQKLGKAPFKYQIFFTLAVYTGLRRAELLGLEWSDFDFHKCTVQIRRTSNYTRERGIYTDTTKTKTSQRTVGITSDLAKLLIMYREYQKSEFQELVASGQKIVKTDRLFTQTNGNPMHPNTPYQWLKRMCRINDLDFYGVHTFRHLNASLQINAGVDTVSVAATLGHSTPMTTLTIYSHCFSDAKNKSLNAVSTALDL